MNMGASQSHPGHPRRTRLGLIEARPTTDAAHFLHGGIRGAHASASLKRPERSAPKRKSPWRIRGAHASASLKRGFLQRPEQDPATHPRRTRLGLIEAMRMSVRTDSRPWHPRRTRLGLIEAGTWSRLTMRLV